MKKNLFIIISIFIIILAILFYFYYNIQKNISISKSINLKYEQCTEGEILGSTLMTVINKASNDNEKNKVEKNEKNTYIENDKNSIKIDIKFAESDDIYPMEAISSLGTEKFIKNYSGISFKCTKKEYHSKTGYIKYMLFEEVTE